MTDTRPDPTPRRVVGCVVRLTDRYGFVRAGFTDYFFHPGLVEGGSFEDLVVDDVVVLETSTETTRGPRAARVIVDVGGSRHDARR